MLDLQLSVLRRRRTSGGGKIVGGEESEFDIRATVDRLRTARKLHIRRSFHSLWGRVTEKLREYLLTLLLLTLSSFFWDANSIVIFGQVKEESRSGMFSQFHERNEHPRDNYLA